MSLVEHDGFRTKGEKRRRSSDGGSSGGGSRSEINMRVDENMREGDKTMSTRMVEDSMRLWCSACNCYMDSNKSRAERHLHTTKHIQNADIYRRNIGLVGHSSHSLLASHLTLPTPSNATSDILPAAGSNGEQNAIGPAQVRLLCRSGQFTGQTAGLAPGYAQANLVILPKQFAFDFLLFCQRNPKPCPLLEVLADGNFILPGDINIRSDVPKYRVYEYGKLKCEMDDISAIWQDDFVTFVIGK